jgi:hypothetical protein
MAEQFAISARTGKIIVSSWGEKHLNWVAPTMAVGYSGLRSSVWYFGASSKVFFINAAWPAASSLGGGAVRFSAGTPTCAKNSSWPAGRRADTEQSRRLPGSVGKRVRCVRWNMDSLPGAHDRLFAAEGGVDLAFKDRKRLLKIMAVGWRTAAGRNVHINQAIATSGIVARE